MACAVLHDTYLSYVWDYGEQNVVLDDCAAQYKSHRRNKLSSNHLLTNSFFLEPTSILLAVASLLAKDFFLVVMQIGLAFLNIF